jgi:SAM-dependent methyltransferase
MKRYERFLVLAFLLSAVILNNASAQLEPSWNMPTETRPALDVPFVPTPMEVVQKMLSMADVNSKDILYDLGCGDGRIVITAAKERKVRKAIGFDLDPARIEESNRNARQAGVDGTAEFQERDLFDVDLGEATVVTMYLLPTVNLKLRPKILKELKPGTRIVSHDFDMGGWQPDSMVELGIHTVFFWVVPGNVSGNWTWTVDDGEQQHKYELRVQQQYQKVTNAELKVDGVEQTVEKIELKGNIVEFTVQDGKQQLRFTGTVKANSIKGTVALSGERKDNRTWNASRNPSTVVSIDKGSELEMIL